MCQSLQFFGELEQRTTWEAKVALEELREVSSFRQRSLTALPPTNSDDLVCASCSGILSDDSVFYYCLVRSCRGMFCMMQILTSTNSYPQGLYHCAKCVQDKKDTTGEHQLWHTLLVLRKDLVDVGLDLEPLIPTTDEKSPEVEMKAEITEDPRHATIISSIADINTRINDTLEERISKIEYKMDNMMTELKELLTGLAKKTSSTI